MTNKSEKIQTIKTDLPCPCCKKPMYRQFGNQMFPGNRDYGMMLFCIHGDPNARRHPQEVAGHGSGRSDEAMLKDAYAIIQSKFCGAKYEAEGELVEVDASEVVTAPKEEPKKAKRKGRQNPPVVDSEDDAL